MFIIRSRMAPLLPHFVMTSDAQGTGCSNFELFLSAIDDLQALFLPLLPSSPLFTFRFSVSLLYLPLLLLTISIYYIVGPVFHLNAYETSEERQQVVVRLSAPILARNFVPDFNGTIVVTIKCGDLTDGDSRRKANFGKQHPCTQRNCIINRNIL